MHGMHGMQDCRNAWNAGMRVLNRRRTFALLSFIALLAFIALLTFIALFAFIAFFAFIALFTFIALFAFYALHAFIASPSEALFRSGVGTRPVFYRARMLP